MEPRLDLDFLVDEDEVRQRCMVLRDRIDATILNFINELHPSDDVDEETLVATALALDYCNAEQWADICQFMGYAAQAEEVGYFLVNRVYDGSNNALNRITGHAARRKSE